MDLRFAVKNAVRRLGYEVRAIPPVTDIPDADLYTPMFSPWLDRSAAAAEYRRIRPYTLVSPEKCYVLHTLATQAARLAGEFVECGTYKGGTAMLLASIRPTIHLFDTFTGMPPSESSLDLHPTGTFSDTSAESVQARVPRAILHPGFIPDTFGALPERIAFAHIDVDHEQTHTDCCEAIYPRMVPGGFIVFDDYGFPATPGARKAVDAFFADKPVRPLVLQNSQAVVFCA